jgi:uncharacterized membrane protein YqjE
VSGGPSGGLSGALARLGESSLEFVRTRVDLAALEFSEEHDRRKDQLLLVGVAAVAFAFALFAASAFVVAYFWDSHRLWALGGVTLLYLLIAAGALWRLEIQRRTSPRPFAATLAELERDRQWLAEQFGGDGADK